MRSGGVCILLGEVGGGRRDGGRGGERGSGARGGGAAFWLGEGGGMVLWAWGFIRGLLWEEGEVDSAALLVEHASFGWRR